MAGPRQGTNPTDNQRAWLREAWASYYPPLCRYVVRHTRDPQAAEDLVQDVFADLVASAPRVARDRPLWPWLLTVARRRIVDDYRRHLVSPPAALSDALETVPVEALSAEDTLFLPALAALPPLQRCVCAERLICGRTFAEIARNLGSTASACRMTYSRGVRSMRRFLHEADGVA